MRRSALPARRALLAVLAWVATACVGRIGEPGARPGAPAGDAGDAAAPAARFSPAPARLRRLTDLEFANSLRDLLGADPGPVTFEPIDPELYGFASVGASQVTLSQAGIEQWHASVFAAVHTAFADAARAQRIVGCDPARLDDPCVGAFVAAFGRRAWRRPLLGGEVAGYIAAASRAHGGDPVWTSLEYLAAALLASPNFALRLELGAPDAAHPGWVRFTDFEQAARLAYFLWASAPDDALLDAAAAGALATPAGLRAQATRLLADDRARAALVRFFGEWLHLDALDHLTRDAASYPNATPTLGPAMREEIERVIADVVFDRDADARELFDTRATFVNAELAAIYGVAAPAGGAWQRALMPGDGGRAGLTGLLGVLALNAKPTRGSPTVRGAFVRERLLCMPVDPPPANVNTNLPEPPSGAPARTMREQLAVHRTNAACAGCHNQIDPIGLSLEHFDAVGAFRATDHGAPIDDSGAVDGVAFQGAGGLARLLHDDPRASRCLVRQLYRYALGRVDTASDAAAIDALVQSFAGDGYRVLGLVRALVASDAFRYAAPAR